MSLVPYNGNWTTKEARHLLKRTTFGATQTLVQESVNLGLQGTINKLFEDIALPNPPLKYQEDGTTGGRIIDPDAAYGETWITGSALPNVSDTTERNRIINSRKRSLYGWLFLQMENANINIREKLTLFWHNHFVAVNQNPHREYFYFNTLRKNATGNVIQLTKEITIDPTMLLYLSGSVNTNVAPNENYARELLELFTIGKGAAIGNADYTNYTETDVVEIAKILTGWRVRSLSNVDATIPFFSNFFHTKGTKTLSHRFANAVINENGENEYKDIIDKIFEQEECSRFICRQLYIWFVNYNITPEIESQIIEPLAAIMRVHNYDIKPPLETLFASQHFFDNVFCMVKSPIDLIFSATKSLKFNSPTSSVKENYEYGLTLYNICIELEQGILNHPDVAGWKAYYQEPLFYKTWINNFLLPKRSEYCKLIVKGGSLRINNVNYNIPPLIPVLQIAASITNATDPNILITELANRMFNYEISASQLTALKEILIPGLPDFEWTIEYGDYLNNPSNVAIAISVDTKLRNLIATMVQMSEFQIM